MKPRWNTSPVVSAWLSGYVARNNTCIVFEIIFPITRQKRKKRNRTSQRDKEYLKQGIWMQLVAKYFSSMCFAKIRKTIEILKIYLNSVPHFSTQYNSGDINVEILKIDRISFPYFFQIQYISGDINVYFDRSRKPICSPFYQHRWTSTPAWVCNHVSSKVMTLLTRNRWRLEMDN